MKAILEFDLEDPDDAMSHRRCVSATDAFLVLHDICERFRTLDKDDVNINPSDMRREFYDFLEDRSVNLDHLQ